MAEIRKTNLLRIGVSNLCFLVRVLSSKILFCSLLGYEGLEVVNPEGGQEDGEEEANKGRFRQEVVFVSSLFIDLACSQFTCVGTFFLLLLFFRIVDQEQIFTQLSWFIV